MFVSAQNSRYDAFGEKIDGTGDVSNKYQFAGEQYDSNLGDYYLRARYYDTDSGRFTRRDTYEAGKGDLSNLNKYVYASNNPATGIDPSGLYVTSIGELSRAEKLRADLEAAYRLPAAVRAYETTRSSLYAVAAAVAGALALAAATSIAVAKSLNRQFGIPVVFWGNDLPETTQHQFRAITGRGYTLNNNDGSGFGIPISPALHRSANEHDRGWLKSIPQGQNLNSAINDRDEFPFAKVIEGGQANYNFDRVSVHQLSLNTNRKQGRWMKTFWDRAGVAQYEINQNDSLFLNIPVPALGISFGLDRNKQVVNVYGSA